MIRVVLGGEGLAGFPAGEANGHHLANRSEARAVVLEVGTRAPERDSAVYPDIDLFIPEGTRRFHHRNGTPYPPSNGAPPSRSAAQPQDFRRNYTRLSAIVGQPAEQPTVKPVKARQHNG